jgi:hypothetical protein
MGDKGITILYLNKLPLVRVIFKNWPLLMGKSMVGNGAYTCMKGVV